MIVRTTRDSIIFFGDDTVNISKKSSIVNVEGGVKIFDKRNSITLDYAQLSNLSSLTSNSDLYNFLHEIILDDGISWDLQYSKAILESEGIFTSVIGKSKSLLKFGSNDNISNSVYSTIQTFPAGQDQENFLNDNLITHFASSDAGDTDIELVLEGHVLSDGQLLFQTQTVTLNGQTKTAVTTPLARVTRAYNNNSDAIVGVVSFSEDVSYSSGVPSDATKVHMIIPAGAQQTQKLSTTISYNDAWFVTALNFDVIQKTSTTMSARITARQYGRIFRTQETIGASDGSGANTLFTPHFIVRPNSDIKVDALSSGNDTSASGSLQGYLAKVIAR